MTYPNFAQVIVEVAFSSSTATYAVWDAGLFDTAIWGPGIEWVDVTSWVKGFNFSFGRQRETDHYQPGTGAVRLSNIDARFSPANLAGPYVTGGITGIRPLRPIRIRAVWAGTTYPVAYGFLGDPVEMWDNESPAEIVLPFTDGLSLLANFDGPALTLQGAHETSGQRIQRILANAGWLDSTNVSVGTITCQPTTLASNALTELYLTADSEGGAVWVDPDGSFVFEHQYALIENTRSNTTQATFGDGAGELPYAEAPEPVYSRDLLTNRASIARVGSTQQTVIDLTSQALYRDRSISRTDLICETDIQTLALAQWTVARYAQPEYRFQTIEINPNSSPALLWPQVLVRRIRDRVVVKRRPFTSSGTPLVISNDSFIDGISVSYSPGSWRTTFQLASATAYNSFASSLWDTGVWDTSEFFY